MNTLYESILSSTKSGKDSLAPKDFNYKRVKLTSTTVNRVAKMVCDFYGVEKDKMDYISNALKKYLDWSGGYIDIVLDKNLYKYIENGLERKKYTISDGNIKTVPTVYGTNVPLVIHDYGSYYIWFGLDVSNLFNPLSFNWHILNTDA
jgi:hypothetical protein